MRAEKANFSVSAMARVFGVTRQGYYAYEQRPASARVQADAALCEQVRDVFDEFEGRYGSPRVFHELRTRGVRTSKRAVERALRGMGLVAVQPRRRHKPTARDLTVPVAPNLLARDFTAQRPDERWVTDITYIWTQSGWVYLAAILDLFSRAVVGWAVSTDVSTKLPLEALQTAITRRRPETGLLHHSDRGCQYTSDDYRATLASLGITVSMSRRGNCWDNAVAESFFATLKNELIHRRTWKDVEDVRSHVFEYIEVFYNRRRMHSALAYKSPANFEQEFAATAA
jgi:transposase InsO family protein